MAKQKNGKIHNVYLLSRDKLQEKFAQSKNASIDDLIDSLMNCDECSDYDIQTQKENIFTGDFSVRLYFAEIYSKSNKLSSFCSMFIKDDQSVITFSPKTASSILFIWDKNNIFAITSGQGYHIIQSYCVPKFGLMVATHYLKYLRITALDSNEFAGSVHSTKTIYSNEMNFVDIDSLDTIYKEITGRLNSAETVHNLLDLDEDDKKISTKIIAKDYFQLSSSMNFDKLIHFLTELCELDLSGLEDSFNSITPISHKDNKAIIQNNNYEVIKSLYSSVKTNQRVEFDLFNKDTNQFIGADCYKIIDNKKNILTSEDEIEALPFISEAYSNYLDGNPASLETFAEFVQSSNIVAYKGDYEICNKPLLEHIYGEVTVNKVNYFVVYGDYYLLTQSYCKRLNQIFNVKTKPHISQIISTEWVRSQFNEDKFNQEVAISENFVLLHRVLVDKIEFADLLKFENEEFTIVHVKDRFDNEMRALDRQVELSIKMISDLLHNNYEKYFRDLYANAVSSNNSQSQKIKTVFKNADEFISSLKTYKIKYCIAIRPENSDLAKSQSNIAKHCLNLLLTRCAVQGYELIINIIKTI